MLERCAIEVLVIVHDVANKVAAAKRRCREDGGRRRSWPVCKHNKRMESLRAAARQTVKTERCKVGRCNGEDAAVGGSVWQCEVSEQLASEREGRRSASREGGKDARGRQKQAAVGLGLGEKWDLVAGGVGLEKRRNGRQAGKEVEEERKRKVLLVREKTTRSYYVTSQKRRFCARARGQRQGMRRKREEKLALAAGSQDYGHGKTPDRILISFLVEFSVSFYRGGERFLPGVCASTHSSQRDYPGRLNFDAGGG